jgi:hypothetical protein
MMGRRLVALLCVLLMHAWAIYQLSDFYSLLNMVVLQPRWTAEFEPEPITLDLPPLPPGFEFEEPPVHPTPRTPAPAQAASPPAPPSGGTTAITDTSKVDWPLEGKKAAARVLAREAEAERLARMFAGPGGTWASLTKRQRSKLNKFRWRPGVTGLEYDSQGNQIYHISDGCMIVNSGYIACKIGKVKVRGDMFENMREYFDELRLPETNEGNGTEPEALRPPY